MGFRVFKTTYKDRKGKTQEAAKWYVEFRDHLDTVRRLPGFASKSASEEMGRNLLRLVEFNKGTGGQVDPALSRWLTGLPETIKTKLAEIGLLDRERVAVTKLLVDHLADWTKALEAKANSPAHVQTLTNRVRKIIDGCGFKHQGDIRASRVQSFLNDLRADTEAKRGISAQTFNFYLGNFKSFCRWLVRDRRAVENPVAHLSGLNVKTDRRHDRRALTLDELLRLLDATRNGPENFGMTGPARALLYRLGVETGLRMGEMRSLVRSSFDLTAENPTVTVQAEYSKRRRQDVIPLRPALADALRPFLALLTPTATVFRFPPKWDVIDMFRADLEAAKIPYRDEADRVADAHCLRHTFISNLAKGGVHPKVAQALARHSTITLTMDRYSHTLHEDQAQALESLPDLSTPAAAQATGTDGRRLGVQLGASEAISGGAGRLGKTKGSKAKAANSPEKTTSSARKADYTRKDSNLQPMVPKTIALSS